MWAGPIRDAHVGTLANQLYLVVFCGKLLTIMGRYCIVWGCSNTNKNGVSLFQFPKEMKLRKVWTTQVKKTRAKWKGPTANSAVCSEHFTADCFDITSATAEKLDIKMKQRLRAEAVPTIFPQPPSESFISQQPRTSRAQEKRECSRVKILYNRIRLLDF